MPAKLKFSFSIATLTHGAEAICDAAEAYPAEMNARLPASYVADTRTLLTAVTDRHAAQQQQKETQSAAAAGTGAVRRFSDEVTVGTSRSTE